MHPASVYRLSVCLSRLSSKDVSSEALRSILFIFHIRRGDNCIFVVG